MQYCTAYSGFHLDPELASRDEGAPREGRTRGAVGGIVSIVIIKFGLEPEFLDTEFRYFWALNGRDFGS